MKTLLLLLISCCIAIGQTTFQNGPFWNFKNSGITSFASVTNFVSAYVPISQIDPTNLVFNLAGGFTPIDSIGAYSTNHFLLDPPNQFATTPPAGQFNTLVISGTSTVSTSGGNLTLSGSSAGMAALQSTNQSLAPYAYAEMGVSASSSCTPFVGFAKDGNNQFWCYVSSGDLQAAATVGGSGVGFVDTGVSLTPPYSIRLQLSYPEMWIWYSNSSTSGSWAYAARTPCPSTPDVRTLTQWQGNGYLSVYGADRSAGGSATINWIQSGYIGGMHTRDYKIVSHQNGKPYIVGSKFFTTTTMANSGSFQGSSIGVVSYDANNNFQPDLVSQWFFNINAASGTNAAAAADTCVNFYGGQLLLNDTSGQWLFLVNSWGWSDGGNRPVFIWAATNTTSATPFDYGVHAIQAVQLPIPTANSLYDNAQRFDGTNWFLYCAQSDALTSWANFYATYYTGTNLNNLTQVFEDTTNKAEGENIFECYTNFYVTAGGGGSPWIWDSNLKNRRDMTTNVTISGTGVSWGSSHFPIIPLNIVSNGVPMTVFTATLFSADMIQGAQSTIGKLTIETAMPVINGNQWPP